MKYFMIMILVVLTGCASYGEKRASQLVAISFYNGCIQDKGQYPAARVLCQIKTDEYLRSLNKEIKK